MSGGLSVSRVEESIPERVRAQLISLGLPPAKHVPSVLAGLFPSEFNIPATGLNTADLARVLVHLAGHGLISISEKAQRAALKRVKPGWHSCQFYRDTHQLLDLVAPYIADGLKNGEACLWVLPQTVERQTVYDALAGSVDDVESRVDSGQLEVLPATRWYLDASGRLKSFEEISTALLGRQNQALARGFRSLRAAGDTGWISGSEASKDFIDYEMKVNAVIGATQTAAICTYRADVTADELVSIVIAHQDALLGAGAR